jgi:hypothetical protein
VSFAESTASCEGKTSGTGTAIYDLGERPPLLGLNLRLPDHRTYDACRRKCLAIPSPVSNITQFAEAVTQRVVALSNGASKLPDKRLVLARLNPGDYSRFVQRQFRFLT